MQVSKGILFRLIHLDNFFSQNQPKSSDTLEAKEPIDAKLQSYSPKAKDSLQFYENKQNQYFFG